MRSFSDEKKQGTLELLLTKPISHLKIVLGKYFGALFLIILALIPTLLYVITVHQLGDPIGNLDIGACIGSYLGLLFLAAAYCAIGVFSSTLSDNQIVAFIIAVFLCFFFYIGFDGLAEFLSSTGIEQIGMSAHYESMSKGVLDMGDILYFVSISIFFIALTQHHIRTKKAGLMKPLILLVVLVGLNLVASKVHVRIDLTEDQRYTLNTASETVIEDAQMPLIIDVFLEGEDFTSEFRRLQIETRQLLEEFTSINNNIKYVFIDPLEDEETREQNIQQLAQRGLTPMQVSVQESGRARQEVVFPWALASYEGVTVKIPLIKNKIGASQQELVTNSIQHLEYAFIDGFSKLLYPKKRKIAVLQGNGELPNGNIADFVTTLRDYYFIAPFTLDSVATNASETLNKLNEFDLIISAKPTEAFSEEEKYVVDQYTMQGGKSLWLIDAVAMDIDSLYSNQGSAIAVPRDLNLTDFFFKYGIRINPVLVNDLYSAPIPIATGDGSQAQFTQMPWFYSPLVNTSESAHPITNNLNLIKLDYANQIDTLKNNVSKTILLQSSELTKIDGLPREIDLSMAAKEPVPEQYSKGRQTLGVLLEGEFTSVYNNRIKPIDLENPINISKPTKMVVIADGDIVKNDIGRNGPLELGFDRFSGQLYGNKEFLLNTVNYLLDDTGLINIRSKDVSVAFLDQEKIASQKTKWQLINLIAPLILLGVFGVVFNYIRRRKYAA